MLLIKLHTYRTITYVKGLKNVKLEVTPEVVEQGHEAILRCSYELEDEPLYSLKFYRGEHEFYRYSPNERPQTKIFNFSWIEVDLHTEDFCVRVIPRVIVFSVDALATADTHLSFMPARSPALNTPLCLAYKFAPLPDCVAMKLADAQQQQQQQRAVRGIHGRASTLSMPLKSVHYSRSGELKLRCNAKIADMYDEWSELRLGSSRQREPVPASGILPASSQLYLIENTLVEVPDSGYGESENVTNRASFSLARRMQSGDERSNKDIALLMILSLGCDALASAEAVVFSRARANNMLYLNFALALSALLVLLRSDGAASWKKRDDKTRCPRVKAMRNFNVTEFLGSWNVVQYYASSEEAITYRCMRAELSVMPESAEVTMNFTYSFADDPINEQLVGNITWTIPAPESPAHWVHAEKPYEGVYNTYILDSDYQSWALLMHCAEKSKTPRYLSSFIMSRKTNLTNNVITYLREKLPR
ncbi:unnamed protein product [Trichogramma brassicae]|uniref:Lipocalin/cytosolic fatty-acid binding domain-containing protein n=1 Tax=Trichogramma brassicae TaxID=86971 RepID=A0A6H5IWY2_9HYME|nr:unnamed protein product [Trichogramma brassicae]